jgi:hypothetical protein
MGLVEGASSVHQEVECRECGHLGARVTPTTLEGWTVGFRVSCLSCGARESVGRTVGPFRWHRWEDVSHETQNRT